MGWNGSGQVVRTDGTRTGTQVWQDADAAGVKIVADGHDTHDEDLADAIENSIAIDGQNTTTTDNSLLRFDSGNSQFEGVAISASRFVGRAASGDIKGLDATSALSVLGLSSTDSGKGADLISYPKSAGEIDDSTTITNPQYPVGDARRYGAIEGVSADSAAAIQKAYDLAKSYGQRCIIDGMYRIDSGLSFDASSALDPEGDPSSQVTVEFRNAIILKNYSGSAGITLSGGAYYNELNGNLLLTKMVSVADGTSSTGSAGDYGVVQNSRVRQFGYICVQGHQDNGWHINADTNLNGCHFDYVLSQENNGHGFSGEGMQDDVADWTGRLKAKGNYESGFYFPDTFLPRAWNMHIRAESNANDGTSDQVYTGGMSESFLVVYAEASGGTGTEINIPSASENVAIASQRINTQTVDSSSCVIFRGGPGCDQYVMGSTPTFPGKRFANFTDNIARVGTRTDYGSSSAPLWIEKWYGNGDHELIADDRGGGNTVSLYFDPSNQTVTIKVDGSAVAKFTADGGLGIGNSENGTSLGSVTKKIQVFDESGSSLGYIPVYDAIT